MTSNKHLSEKMLIKVFGNIDKVNRFEQDVRASERKNIIEIINRLPKKDNNGRACFAGDLINRFELIAKIKESSLSKGLGENTEKDK